MWRWFSFAGLFLIALDALPARCGENHEFPVPRGEKEFVALLPHIKGYASIAPGDSRLFIRAVTPYGPMNLEVRRARSFEEANTVRSLYLGAVGAAFGIDPLRFTNEFHCGPDCIAGRMAVSTGSLDRITALVHEFESLSRVRLLAWWGITGEYRVNDLYHMASQTNEAIPSPVMGFVPSGDWRNWKTPEAFLATVGVKPETIRTMLTEMKETRLVAIVRDGGGAVRAIGSGIGDNESGLWFIRPAMRIPRVGDRSADGREIVFAEKVGENVFYYETS